MMLAGIAFFIHACGEPPDDYKKGEPSGDSAQREVVQRMSPEVEEVKKLKRETDCIRVFVKDMTMQQQAPIEGWEQPDFAEYEKKDCRRTMRPIR